MSKCERCGQSTEHLSISEVTIGDKQWNVCGNCVHFLEREINEPLWYDRFEKKHYDKAVEYLRDIDKIWCVKGDYYDLGEIWVHSPYLRHNLVGDIVDLMNMHVLHVSVVMPESYDGPHDCVYEHGPCVEYLLDYKRTQPPADPCALDQMKFPEHKNVHETDRLDKAGALANYYWRQAEDLSE